MRGCSIKEKKLKDILNSFTVIGKDTTSVKDRAAT